VLDAAEGPQFLLHGRDVAGLDEQGGAEGVRFREQARVGVELGGHGGLVDYAFDHEHLLHLVEQRL